MPVSAEESSSATVTFEIMKSALHELESRSSRPPSVLKRPSFAHSQSEVTCSTYTGSSSSSSVSVDLRNVSFSEDIDVIGKRCRTTSSAKRSCWYSVDDLDDIKAENYLALQHLMKYNRVDESKNMCSRGLECMTRAGSLQAKNRRKSALRAVLDAQSKQESDDQEQQQDSHERVAEAYRRASSRSVAIAKAMAIRDAKEAGI